MGLVQRNFYANHSHISTGDINIKVKWSCTQEYPTTKKSFKIQNVDFLTQPVLSSSQAASCCFNML
jgi:hypothetical protein